MTLRVLLVGPVPPPNGGMALQTQQLHDCLRTEQISVTLCPVNPPYRPQWAGRIPLLRALFRLLPYLLRLRRELKRHDIVHIMANSGWSWHLFAAPALWLAHRAGVPSVLNYRGGLANEFFARSFHRVWKTLRYAGAVIVPTGFLQDVFKRYGVAAGIVPNILDLGQFSGAGQTEARREQGPHIVVTRNLEALYDNATAVQAFARVRQHIPEARLTLAGEGPERSRLEQLAGELQCADAVHFAGRLPRERIASLLQSAAMICNPSLADNSPNSLIEAMAAGTPIVSTNVGGIPWLVQDGVHALLVPAGDAGTMAQAMMKLLHDPELRAQLIAAGRVKAREFTWPKVREVLLPLYQKLADARK